MTRGYAKLGNVDGAGNPLIIRFMGPSEIVGCMAVFRQVPYPLTATAVSETVTLAWPWARITGLLERYPLIGPNALQILGTRGEEMLQRLGEMATERVESRIAKTLLRLCRGKQPNADSRVEIGFAVSRQDIAEMAGTDVYNASRVLSRWRRQGIVETHRQKIAIRAMPSLNRLAAGKRLITGTPN